jgi:hypothetical protein
MIRTLFLTHPRTQGESYLEHARFAAGLGFWMTLAGLAALVHAVLPFTFQTTASGILARVQARIDNRGH